MINTFLSRMDSFINWTNSFASGVVNNLELALQIAAVLSIFVVALAIIRIPGRIEKTNKNIKKLTQTLIRLHTDETNEPGGSDYWKKRIDEKYLDKQAWGERSKQMEQFQHSEKPAKERWDERVKWNKQYWDQQEEQLDEKIEKKRSKKTK